MSTKDVETKKDLTKTILVAGFPENGVVEGRLVADYKSLLGGKKGVYSSYTLFIKNSFFENKMKKISSICILAITLFSQGTYADDGKSTYCPGLGDMYASERAKHNGEKNNPNYCSEQESIDKKYDRRLNFMQEQLDLHCGNHYPKETVNAADKEIVTINCKL